MRLWEAVASFVSGRVGKWVVLAVWLALLAVAGPLGGKLQSALKNDPAAYLPANAQSTRVLDLAKRLPGGDTNPAVIVYRRATGLTAADRARIAADARRIEALGLPGVRGATEAAPSPDGKAALLVVPIRVGNDATKLVEDVRTLRDTVGEGGGGLAVRVTGGAGFSADAITVFNGIDTKLLFWTVAIVALILLITYRSPFLWLVPLLVVGVADQVASAAAYLLTQAGLVVNGQTSGILRVLVYGAGTDYALLIVARYREELRRHPDRHDAMTRALGRAGPAILASGGTVILALLCLLAAELNSDRGLGPVAAIGITCALLAMLTALPALLVALPRGAFWPRVPRFGSAATEETGPWARMAGRISRRPRTVWIGTALALGALSLGLLGLDTNLSQVDQYRGSVDSVAGQRLISLSYPPGVTAPTQVVVQPPDRVNAAIAAARTVPGVASVAPPETSAPGLASFQVTLRADPYSGAAMDTIRGLRSALERAAGPGALVGGPSAIQLDVDAAAKRDFRVIAPLVLVVVFSVLALLLRAVAAPLLLVGTVILSFAAALGASVLAFAHLFGFQGMYVGLPLYAFIFLVALGVDYNIFLMARVREETQVLGGTREGMRRGLAVTGGVITSAGIVLASTFSVLGVLPFVPLTEIGFIVAFGVLLDTLVVRSILVPALTFDLGRRIWWPGRIAVPGAAAARARAA